MLLYKWYSPPISACSPPPGRWLSPRCPVPVSSPYWSSCPPSESRRTMWVSSWRWSGTSRQLPLSLLSLPSLSLSLSLSLWISVIHDVNTFICLFLFSSNNCFLSHLNGLNVRISLIFHQPKNRVKMSVVHSILFKWVYNLKFSSDRIRTTSNATTMVLGAVIVEKICRTCLRTNQESEDHKPTPEKPLYDSEIQVLVGIEDKRSTED